MKNGKLQAAVIGCGNISKTHIAGLQALEGVEIAVVCDIKPERAHDAAQATGAKACSDWHEAIALPEIDVVHICLPHYLHAPVAIEALGLGKNVLTEKPMATTVADARAMIEASEKEGAGMLGVIFQNRYNAAVQRALEIIKTGEMGAFLGARAEVSWLRSRSYYVDSGWRGSKLTEGAGSLINQAIHTLDLLSFLGGPIAKVRGAVFTGLLENDIEVEDNAMAVAIYEGGQRAIIHTTNNYVANAPVEIELQMEKGVLKLYGDNLFKVEKDSFELIARGANKPVVGKAYWGTSHGTQIADYYDSIRKGEAFWIDGRSGLPALALVCAIVQSSDEACWVEIEKA